ncbi:MAG: NAD-glutamate dehydrogenase [Campylobacterota bacterium]|nr:NAD-glutamate dehydrogenase [Campylobacterota bacterium]
MEKVGASPNMTSQIDQQIFKELESSKITSEVLRVNDMVEVTIYSLKKPTLSDYMPMLQNFRFDIDKEYSYEYKIDDLIIYSRKYLILNITKTIYSRSHKNIKLVIDAVLQKKMLNSEINCLSITANLNPKQLGILNTLLVYEEQILPKQSKDSIKQTLIKYPDISSLFIKYFLTKFDKKLKDIPKQLENITDKLNQIIKEVKDITDDKILIVFFHILKALVRTNFFKYKNIFLDHALAIKIDVTKLMTHLSGVQPKIEIFVFHNKFKGTHLRRTKVSRGGLRWSDRSLDYRDEIKSLMQAQRSKNSVIIPQGAKGGFFINNPKATKDDFKEVYTLFINALIDVVDNYKDNIIVQDNDILIYDDEDPYFVVAADKGTSSMSDVANSISIKRDFWLGDAFASGGTNGYNHKTMGITAKGSIRSVERFFIQNNKNFYNEPISVVGIGSPSGDVFGNGIQLSQNFKLIGAISSKNIFIDPDPDLEKAYKERERLFKENQSWEHYDTTLISLGGGVFCKSDKSIKLSSQIKELLNIKVDVLNGEELSKAVLRAKVDLLFNGGVGTYVKGNDESDSQIGDKPNESVRVRAKDIQAYAVCEGGNLGFTQKARVDYALKGGKINTDSIDNSAGVHTSDYEVNLKIILNSLVTKNVISDEQRLEVLHSLESDVERTVIWTNYFQSLALSLDEIRSSKELEKFKSAIQVLEVNIDNFVPKEYEIPSALELDRILTKEKTLIRPILSVMLSFAKMFVKVQILNDKSFLETPIAIDFLYKYFPKSFDTLYSKEVNNHPLKNEIIATNIANMIINTQGSTFISDFNRLGAKQFMLKIKAFIVLNDIVSASDIRHEIFREDYNIDYKKQYKYLIELDDALEFLTYWVIEHGENEILIFERMHEYKLAMSKFIDNSTQKGESSCNNTKIRKFFSMIEYIRMLTTIIKVKEDVKYDFFEIANLFLSTTEDLNILELNRYIKELEVNSIWDERLQQRMVKNTLQIVSDIIDKVMHFKRSTENIEDAIGEFKKINEPKYKQYKSDLKALKESGNITFVNLNVVIGTLGRIAQ